ncbi:ADP-ribosylglycohydrolase family protein [Eubacteriales bacterium OttesenSCG-928-A19]|nr:ADP-ribosylglycohydrolase family protein [Eubacteriales bacterium OttesenSCG-928-A19]
MLGAIIGDYVGSAYEDVGIKTTDFPWTHAHSNFTDDTVLTVAVADALLHGFDMANTLRCYGRAHMDAGYGVRFLCWIINEQAPSDSYGNGSAMRVSPCGWLYNSMEETLAKARMSALPTHAHPEGIKGAEAIASCIFLLRRGADKGVIHRHVHDVYYPLDFTLDSIRATYKFDASCQGSVPQAIEAFLESWDFESAVRLAVSLGGDSDTLAAMAGSLAEAAYGIPDALARPIIRKLPDDLAAVLKAFFFATGRTLPEGSRRSRKDGANFGMNA